MGSYDFVRKHGQYDSQANTAVLITYWADTRGITADLEGTIAGLDGHVVNVDAIDDGSCVPDDRSVCLGSVGVRSSAVDVRGRSRSGSNCSDGSQDSDGREGTHCG